MANSNGRVKDYGTVHHLVSRIAHRVYFLKEEERGDFLEMAECLASLRSKILTATTSCNHVGKVE